MATSTPTLETPRRLSFTVDQYERMGRAGILHEDARFELVEGDVVEMAPIGPPHASAVRALAYLLNSLCGDRAVVDVQSPIRLGDHSEPQPDVALLIPPLDRYRTRHPGSGDILLVVEVADTTLAYDRQVKVPLYARHGVAEAWVVDLGAGAVEVHRSPSQDGYAGVTRVGRRGRLSVEALPGVEVGVAEIL